jgi:hypothetical protein
MSESKEAPMPALPNRRKEIFRAVRGSKLTGQRGNWPAAAHTVTSAGKERSVLADELQIKRRVRLGSVIEDEADRGEPPVTRRYSEPND